MRTKPKAPGTLESPAQDGESRLLLSAREIFGDALTILLLTGHTDHPRRWDLDQAVGALADQRNAASLRTAVAIAAELLKVEAKSTVQAWFVGQNPMLNDRAPALIVRSDPDSVWAAAKHVVASGLPFDPFEAALEGAAIDDEPFSEADREASETGWHEYLKGEFSSLDDFLGRDNAQTEAPSQGTV